MKYQQSRQCWNQARLAAGEHVAEFEKLFADYCRTAHAIAVNNGTAALHAALLAADIGHGDEVIVPSFSFIATATAVSMTGARPVFADVNEQTFNIDPLKVEDCITSKTGQLSGFIFSDSRLTSEVFNRYANPIT